MSDQSQMLYLGIFSNIRTTFISGAGLIALSGFNWFFIITQSNFAIKLTSIGFLLILTLFINKYFETYWKNYEWNL
jgi:ABC-type transport system involved in cytochrome bd biosynthesis fused ATPase/permease subunit